jgi:hypothetical protein
MPERLHAKSLPALNGAKNYREHVKSKQHNK